MTIFLPTQREAMAGPLLQLQKERVSVRLDNQLDPSLQQAATSVTATERPILIVEDDSGMSTMLMLALEDANYSVQLAFNGAEALELLQQIRPRLILLDLRMPVMDGQEFLRQLRIRPEQYIPPIIVMTAYPNVDPAVVELGLPWLTKPMRLDTLLQIVAQYAEST